MKTKQQVNTEITWLETLHAVVGVYEEVAASRMQKVRKGVLANRIYFDEVNQVFQHVKSSYRKEIDALQKKQKHLLSYSVRPHNGKTALVFVSANAGLYGDIVEKTFQSFLTDVKKQAGDPIIIGQLGKTLFTNESKTPYTFFEFPDTDIDKTYLEAIIKTLTTYEKVYVYHGMFKNIIHQDAAVTNLTADDKPTTYPYNDEVPRKWLFEPTLGSLLDFFENELLTSLFTHTLQESHLAKFASRMVTLDKATDSITQTLGKNMQLVQSLKHAEANKKQLRTLAGMSLWQK